MTNRETEPNQLTAIVQIEIYQDKKDEAIRNLGRMLNNQVIVRNGVEFIDDPVSQNEFEDIYFEQPGFNPDLVTYVEDKDSKTNIPVIKEEVFEAYALEHEFTDKANCTRLMRGLYWSHIWHSSNRVFQYMYDNPLDQKVYLRADMLKQLNRLIKAGEIRIDGYGTGLYKMLKDLENEVFKID